MHPLRRLRRAHHGLAYLLTGVLVLMALVGLAASGQLQRKAVKVLSYDARQAVISEGVAEGDLIVTLGIHTLRSGLKVRPLAETKVL